MHPDTNHARCSSGSQSRTLGGNNSSCSRSRDKEFCAITKRFSIRRMPRPVVRAGRGHACPHHCSRKPRRACGSVDARRPPPSRRPRPRHSTRSRDHDLRRRISDAESSRCACAGATASAGTKTWWSSTRPRFPFLGNHRSRRTSNVAASLACMTLHAVSYEVGVRELHDRLSEHLDRVERGVDIVVTRRGRPIARLSGVAAEDPLEQLVRRGLITPPTGPRRAKRARVKPRGSVSDLVAEQRR